MRPFAALLMLLATAPAALAAPVAVYEDASGPHAAVSVFGNASAQCYYWLACVAVSGTGDASGAYTTVSGTGRSTGGIAAVSGTGSAESLVAVSATNRSDGGVTVSGLGSSDGAIAVGANDAGDAPTDSTARVAILGDAQGGTLAVSVFGDSRARWMAISVFGESEGLRAHSVCRDAGAPCVASPLP